MVSAWCRNWSGIALAVEVSHNNWPSAIVTDSSSPHYAFQIVGSSVDRRTLLRFEVLESLVASQRCRFCLSDASGFWLQVKMMHCLQNQTNF